MQVFGDDQERPPGQLPPEQGSHDLEQDAAARLRIEARLGVAEDVEQQPHSGLVEVDFELAQAGVDARSRDRLRVGLPDAEGASEQAREHRIRRLPIV